MSLRILKKDTKKIKLLIFKAFYIFSDRMKNPKIEMPWVYFGARYYDPAIGRFMGVYPDPERSIHSLNRYTYANNNPYKYVDPDGRLAFLVPVAIFLAKELAAEGLSQATGGATDFLSVRRVATKGVKHAAKALSKGSCCFVAGTEILTKTGYKNIEDVVLGEELWSKNVDTGEQAWKPVTKLFREPGRGIYEILLKNHKGETQRIEATDDHPFYDSTGVWKTTIELKPGDRLETDGQVFMTVVSVTDEKRTELTYNFTVADFHTYYVTKRNVLVHNCPTGVVAKGAPPPNLSPKGAGRTGAFKEAKRQSDIPTSQQPRAVKPNLDRRGKAQPGKVYEFEVPAAGGGTKTVKIRDDAGGHDFGAGNAQNRGPHFNNEAGDHFDY